MKGSSDGESWNMEWFAVRCLFSHPSRAIEAEGNLYEERITLWMTTGFRAAFELAEAEANQYAQESTCVFIEATDAFKLAEKAIQGSEVWSKIRSSHMDPHLYVNTFCNTNQDRVSELGDDED